MAATKRGLAALFGSTVGVKSLMALTGLALIGFLVTHMAGNLLIFFGPEVFNAYAKSLKSAGGGAVVWLARGGLLTLAIVHVGMAFDLQTINKGARPQNYAYPATIQASAASRSMIITGLLILAFVAFHLAHYTIGIVDPAYMTWKDAAGRHDVYRMVTTAFAKPIYTGLYLVAMALLAVHLSHGFQSLFRTLGNSHEKFRCGLQKLSLLLAIGLFLGFSAAPVGILAGVVKPSHPTGTETASAGK